PAEVDRMVRAADALGESLHVLDVRSEEHTSELQSLAYLVCRLLLEKKKCGSQDLRFRHREKGENSLEPCGHACDVNLRGALGDGLDEFIAPAAVFFFFNDTATTEIYTLSLHDALPISVPGVGVALRVFSILLALAGTWARSEEHTSELQSLAYLVCRLLLEKKK